MKLVGEAVCEAGQEEEEWILRVRQGDVRAWDELVSRHRDAAFRLAYLILADADEAEDAAQEAFLRAYHALNRFDTTRPFRPWLMHITRNVARNRRRALGRYLAALRRAFIAGEPREASGPAQAVQKHWRNETLWLAIRQLKPAGQEIIYLRYFLNLSEAETAGVLGVASGTVKSRLHRALAQLQTVIEKEFPALRETWEE